MRLNAMWFLGFVAACSSPMTVTPDAGPVLPTDKPWGADELPAGAEVVSPEEFAQLMATEGFVFITKAELDAKAEKNAKRLADAKALVDGLEADGAVGIKPHALKDTMHSKLRKDGNVDLSLSGGETVMLQGTDFAYGSLAEGLARVSSRENRLSDYTMLYELLADELVVDLPTPAALGAATDADLEEAHAEVTRRADSQLSNELTQTPSDQRLLSFPSTGCSNHQKNNLYASYDWPLKTYTTRVRSQGRRGSCAAFGIVAALETRLARTTGMITDYSEQELYATAKALWFPITSSYGDGLNQDWTLSELYDDGYRVDPESRWQYNPSLSRIDDEDNNTYTHSCDGYSSIYCSNTNHQMRAVCSGNPKTCGYARPPAVLGNTNDTIKLTNYVAIYDWTKPEQSLASVRAHLNAGHPVVFGAMLDEAFKDEADEEADVNEYMGHPGMVSGDGSGADVGYHSMVAVGYIANGALPPNKYLPDGDGGGYLILKNSWGCKGDGGFMYVSYGWVLNHMIAAHAVTSVSSTAKSGTGTIHQDKLQLKTPGETVTLTMNVSREVVKLKLYRNGSQVYSKTLPGTQPETMTVTDSFDTAATNDFYTYSALLTDSFGNEVATNAVSVLVALENQSPAVTLSAVSLNVAAPGKVELRAMAMDDLGVAKVEFYKGLTRLGTDSTTPYAMSFPVGLGDLGTMPYFAIAYDAQGKHKVSNILQVNVNAGLPPLVLSFKATPATLPRGGGMVTLSWMTSRAQTVNISGGIGKVPQRGSVTLNVTQSTVFALTAANVAGPVTRSVQVIVPSQQADTTPPTVMLIGPAAVMAPGTATLVANAMDDVGVTQVEFLRGGTVVATDTTPGDGFRADVALTAADVGTVTWRARASDAAGNTGGSAQVDTVVTVASSPDGGIFVSPNGADGPNTCRVESSPCLTIAYALTKGSEVTLLDGLFTTADQGSTPLQVPAGTVLTAKSSGGAVLGLDVRMSGGTLTGVVIDRDVDAAAKVSASSGTSSLVGVRWRGVFTSGPGLELSGTAQVTLSQGATMNHAANTLASTQPLFVVGGDATLTLFNGTLDGPGVGSDEGAIAVRDTAKLRMDGFTLRTRSRGVKMTGATFLLLDGAVLETATLVPPGSWGIGIENDGGEVAVVTMTNGARISGFVEGAGVLVGLGTAGLRTRAELGMTVDSTLSQNGVGLRAVASSSLRLRATAAHFDFNDQGGIVAEGAFDADLGALTTVKNNGTSTSATLAHWGGLYVDTPAAAVSTVKLRGCEVRDNVSSVSNASTLGNAGITVKGAGTASVDLGRAASPGMNVVAVNQVTGISVSVAGTVYAVGNTFNASTQGASAGGQYVLGMAPCGATTCDVTSGAGLNYAVTAGTLRLAE